MITSSMASKPKEIVKIAKTKKGHLQGYIITQGGAPYEEHMIQLVCPLPNEPQGAIQAIHPAHPFITLPIHDSQLSC